MLEYDRKSAAHLDIRQSGTPDIEKLFRHQSVRGASTTYLATTSELYARNAISVASPLYVTYKGISSAHGTFGNTTQKLCDLRETSSKKYKHSDL